MFEGDETVEISKEKQKNYITKQTRHKSISHDHEHHDHEQHMEKSLEITTHDGAIVGSLRVSILDNYDAVVDLVQKKIQAVSKEIENIGGFIGHIKGLVQEYGRCCRISVVEGENIDRQDITNSIETKAECVFIVFGVKTKELEKVIKKEFSDYMLH